MVRTRKQKNPKKSRHPSVKRKRNKRQQCVRRRAVCFKNVISRVKKDVLQSKPKNLHDAILVASRTLNAIKRNKIKTPRVIKIPKTGGILPLIPIFAGLSALGALSGGAAGIAKAVNDAQAGKRELEEARRHNQTMESIAIGGKGMYLKPYKTGLGLFLRPASASHNYP